MVLLARFLQDSDQILQESTITPRLKVRTIFLLNAAGNWLFLRKSWLKPIFSVKPRTAAVGSQCYAHEIMRRAQKRDSCKTMCCMQMQHIGVQEL
jgi:hypothetical protein